ncbi:MAG: RsmB/NOP family class I SAM-dependent RNA methyltransferase [Deltaproteobacteria bacterium]|nr:RsmB/NOP family class I SAM-dependent RNA methyltransferase [Deltaproteobacteria bacterium]
MAAKINLTFVQKLAKSLFDSSEAQERFSSALLGGEVSEKAVLWLAERPEVLPFVALPAAPWQPSFVDRVAADEKPGKDALHEQGAYYCLDLSSVFSATALSEIEWGDRSRIVLDACSAPGGKAICAWKMLQPSLLVCNEVIAKRAGALISNLKRCRISGSIVTRYDTRELCAAQPNVFPLVIVDAPCSGQSLIAKGDDSPGCFHPATINMNSNRQKRILANCATMTAPGGYLAYMTCTYARQENEAVVEWFLKKFPHFSSCEVHKLEAHRSALSDEPCYRLWPFDGWGAGAFVALLRNTQVGEPEALRMDLLHSNWQFQ